MYVIFVCENEVQTLSRKSHGRTLMSREPGDARNQRPGERYSNGQREKCGQLILSRIIEIVAIRCQTLRLKCTKFHFGSRPRWGRLQT